jgi:hypothetical protein
VEKGAENFIDIKISPKHAGGGYGAWSRPKRRQAAKIDGFVRGYFPKYSGTGVRYHKSHRKKSFELPEATKRNPMNVSSPFN